MSPTIHELVDNFDCVEISPFNWPARVGAAMAGEKTVAKWPEFPAAATPMHGRMGHGSGVDERSWRTRAVGELVEVASCCAWGDEQIVSARPSDLKCSFWSPEELSGFAAVQVGDRHGWNRYMAGVDWIPAAVSDCSAIEWMQALCAGTGEPVLVPADSVLIGRRKTGDVRACAVADSNGCAGAETHTDARLIALYELIERDATAIWWYGRRVPRPIPAEAVSAAADIERFLQKHGRRLWLSDITSDIAVPTVAAISADAQGRRLAIGFATRADLVTATHTALFELMQTELKLAAALQHPKHFPQLDPWLELDIGIIADAVGDVSNVDALVDAGPAEEQLDRCLELIRKAGCRLAFMDFTRPAFGVPVARALSPDLCHWKPRFGRARLQRIASDGFDSLDLQNNRPQLLRM